MIRRYWLAHHQFFRLLRAMDYPLVGINLLLHLTFIAFLPFPTGVLGSHFENPISVATDGVAVAVVSRLEVVLFVAPIAPPSSSARCPMPSTAGA